MLKSVQCWFSLDQYEFNSAINSAVKHLFTRCRLPIVQFKLCSHLMVLICAVIAIHYWKWSTPTSLGVLVNPKWPPPPPQLTREADYQININTHISLFLLILILLLILSILSADIISGTAFIYGHVGCFAEFYFEVSWNNAGVHYSSVHHLHLYLSTCLQSHLQHPFYSGQCGTKPGKLLNCVMLFFGITSLAVLPHQSIVMLIIETDIWAIHQSQPVFILVPLLVFLLFYFI